MERNDTVCIHVPNQDGEGILHVKPENLHAPSVKNDIHLHTRRTSCAIMGRPTVAANKRYNRETCHVVSHPSRVEGDLDHQNMCSYCVLLLTIMGDFSAKDRKSTRL